MQLKFRFFLCHLFVLFWSTHELNEENQKTGPRNLPKNDHIKLHADAGRTISCFVAYRTSTLPFLLMNVTSHP